MCDANYKVMYEALKAQQDNLKQLAAPNVDLRDQLHAARNVLAERDRAIGRLEGQILTLKGRIDNEDEYLVDLEERAARYDELVSASKSSVEEIEMLRSLALAIKGVVDFYG